MEVDASRFIIVLDSSFALPSALGKIRFFPATPSFGLG
jgi:hypothetical protein